MKSFENKNIFKFNANKHFNEFIINLKNNTYIIIIVQFTFFIISASTFLFLSEKNKSNEITYKLAIEKNLDQLGLNEKEIIQLDFILGKEFQIKTKKNEASIKELTLLAEKKLLSNINELRKSEISKTKELMARKYDYDWFKKAVKELENFYDSDYYTNKEVDVLKLELKVRVLREEIFIKMLNEMIEIGKINTINLNDYPIKFKMIDRKETSIISFKKFITSYLVIAILLFFFTEFVITIKNNYKIKNYTKKKRN